MLSVSARFPRYARRRAPRKDPRPEPCPSVCRPRSGPCSRAPCLETPSSQSSLTEECLARSAAIGSRPRRSGCAGAPMRSRAQPLRCRPSSRHWKLLQRMSRRSRPSAADLPFARRTNQKKTVPGGNNRPFHASIQAPGRKACLCSGVVNGTSGGSGNASACFWFLRRGLRRDELVRLY